MLAFRIGTLFRVINAAQGLFNVLRLEYLPNLLPNVSISRFTFDRLALINSLFPDVYITTFDGEKLLDNRVQADCTFPAPFESTVLIIRRMKMTSRPVTTRPAYLCTLVYSAVIWK